VEGDGPRYAGKLELGRRELRLEAGTNGGGTGVVVREIAYSDLSGVSVGRTGKDRIGDRPALVLERRFGDPIRIASVVQAGIVSELAERLAAVLLAAPTRVVVVLPLRAGARARVRALLAEGPPFDPEAAGLDRHQVFLSDREAVFLFEAASPSVIGRLAGTADLWAAAAAWQDCVAGPARLAEDAWSWTRPSAPKGHADADEEPAIVEPELARVD
jgi:hypothetical protein